MCELLLIGCSEPQFYFDKQTELYWMHCPVGQTYVRNQCQGTATTMHWDKALRYCAASSDADLQWRLASRNELISYYLDQGIDKMRIINIYWSSTTQTHQPELAWYVIPRSNVFFTNLKELDGLVLCVAS